MKIFLGPTVFNCEQKLRARGQKQQKMQTKYNYLFKEKYYHTDTSLVGETKRATARASIGRGGRTALKQGHLINNLLTLSFQPLQGNHRPALTY